MQNILQPALAAAAQPGRPGQLDSLAVADVLCDIIAFPWYLRFLSGTCQWSPSCCTVSFKNFEAATYQSYAQASALVANRESPLCTCSLPNGNKLFATCSQQPLPTAEGDSTVI